MLSIGRIGGSNGAPPDAGYYTSSVAKGREDYYAGAGEASGVWLGAGAAVLGLGRGAVAAEGLAALMAGRDPGSGDQLRTLSHPDAVTGFDLTFSVPKSASILYGVGDEDVARKVRDAHDEAVLAAMGYMERAACRTRRGKGGVDQVVGDGFIAGAFRHRTSRAGDPQLHTHVVVGNLTRGPDGRYTTLDGRALYQHAKTASYLYQSELRMRMTERLGVEWTEVQKGIAEVRGISRPVIEHFSERRAEIVAAMKARHSDTARSAQAAALETRRAKDYSVDAGKLAEEWRARAAEHGLGRDELAGLVERLETRPLPDADELRRLASHLADAEGLTRHASTFDSREVLQRFAAAHRYGAPVEDVERLADGFLSSPRVVQVASATTTETQSLRRLDGRHVAMPQLVRYSTPDLLAVEQGLIDSAERRRGEDTATVPPQVVERVIVERGTLSDEQAAMVRSLTTSGDGVQVVRAAAGVGKTYALEAARDAWRAAGYRTYGATLSARAACELRDLGGIDATTIARLRIDLDRGWSFDDRTVVVVDEAAMVGTRDLALIVGDAERTGAKVVLVGDDRQLPEIDAGGAFHGLAQRLGACELHRVRRQRDELDRAALIAFREGRPAEWIKSMDARDRLVIASSAAEQYDRLVSDWWHGRERASCDEQALMLTPTRDAARELNSRAQAHRRAAGQLGDYELTIDNGLGVAEGDRILCLRNAQREIGVLNGQRGTVTAVEEASRSLRIEVDGGEEVVIPPSYIEQGHLALGYAMTVHKSQGMTVERSYVLGSEDLYAELGYTAFSRHRDSCRFYVNAADVIDSAPHRGADDSEKVIERLALTLGRSRAQELATDVRAREDELRTLLADTPLEDSAALDTLLASFPAEAHAADRHTEELKRETVRLTAAEERLATFRLERKRTSRFDRRGHREVDERIAGQQRAVAVIRERLDDLAERSAAARLAADTWLERHGEQLASLVAAERERATRDHDAREPRESLEPDLDRASSAALDLALDIIDR